MSEPLALGPVDIKNQAERKIVLIASLLGIVGLVYVYVKTKPNAAASTVAATTAAGFTPAQVTPTPGTPTGTTDTGPLLHNLEYKLNTDNSAIFSDNISNSGSTFINNQTGTTSGKSGSAAFSGFGISIGGGGGSQSSSADNYTLSTNTGSNVAIGGNNQQAFTTDVTLTNADSASIDQLNNFLLALEGTSAQRAAQSDAATSNYKQYAG